MTPTESKELLNSTYKKGFFDAIDTISETMTKLKNSFDDVFGKEEEDIK